MDGLRVLKGLVGLVLLLGTLLDGLFTERDLFFFGRLDALVVRGIFSLALQTRIISVESGLGALLGRLEPRDLRRRVVDGLLELLTSLGSETGGAVFSSTLLFLGLLGLGLLGLIRGFLL